MTRGVWVSRGEAESTTLDEALSRYEQEVTPGKKTASGEKSFIRIWKATPLAKHTMATIRSTDIAKLRDCWLKDGYAPATVVRRLALLSHVFNVARKEWGMESLVNPIEAVRKPRVEDARSRRLATQTPLINDGKLVNAHASRRTEDGELERVARASKSRLLPLIVIIAVETAMRRSEIAALCWEHVDFVRRVAHLPRTKNGSPRDVPLSSKAVAALLVLQNLRDKDCRSTQETHNADTSRQIDQSSYCVIGMRCDAITRAFERSVKRARIAYEDECRVQSKPIDKNFLIDLRFHDLRHEATSRLANIFPMHELTKITGHKDPKMLMRYYHPDAEYLAKKLA